MTNTQVRNARYPRRRRRDMSDGPRHAHSILDIHRTRGDARDTRRYKNEPFMRKEKTEKSLPLAQGPIVEGNGDTSEMTKNIDHKRSSEFTSPKSR